MKHTHTFETCYKLLGLEQDSSWDDLRKSYRQLIRRWHPDRYPDEMEKNAADSKLKDINTAYTQLSNYYQKTGRLPLAKTHSPQEEKPAANPQPQPRSKSQRPAEHQVNRKSEEIKPENRRSTQPSKSKRRIPAYVYMTILLGLVSLVVFDFKSIEHFINIYRDNTRNYNEVKSKQYNNQVNNTVPTTSEYPGIDTEPAIKQTQNQSNNSAPGQKADKAELQASEKFFTYGSTLADVAFIQGPPDRMEGNTWFYGESEVHFENGLVDYWYRTANKPLKASALIHKHKK